MMINHPLYRSHLPLRPMPLLFLVLILSLVHSSPVPAIQASPHTIHEKQPDGSVIALRLRGDEYFHWHEDRAGYTVVRDKGRSYKFMILTAGVSLLASAVWVLANSIFRATPVREHTQNTGTRARFCKTPPGRFHFRRYSRVDNGLYGKRVERVFVKFMGQQ
jgi:hypothetical protein